MASQTRRRQFEVRADGNRRVGRLFAGGEAVSQTPTILGHLLAFGGQCC